MAVTHLILAMAAPPFPALQFHERAGMPPSSCPPPPMWWNSRTETQVQIQVISPLLPTAHSTPGRNLRLGRDLSLEKH